jgi:hypothetical protein
MNPNAGLVLCQADGMGLCGFVIMQFSTPKPPSRHLHPNGFILQVVREFGHMLAFSREPHEFL